MKLKFLVRPQVMILDDDEDDYNNKKQPIMTVFLWTRYFVIGIKITPQYYTILQQPRL